MKNPAEIGAAVMVFAAISVSAAGIGVRLAKSSGKPSLTFDKKRHFPFWPSTQDPETARLAARQGMWAAFCCSGITAVSAFLAHNGMLLTDGASSQMTAFKAAVFGVLAIGIHKLSPWSAVLALTLFLAERINNPTGQPVIITLILLLCFFNGVRGTVALRRNRLELPAYPAADRTSDASGLPR